MVRQSIVTINFLLKISQSNFFADMHCNEQISVHIVDASWGLLGAK